MKRTENIFIGIDFAKEKFDACYLDEDGVVAHTVFQNAKKDYRKLLSWVKKTSGVKGELDPARVLFCGEHTGECSLPLSEWLVAKGHRIWLDNALRIKNSSGIVRGKSDKADAEMIATYAMEKYKPGKSRLFTPDLEAVKKLKALYYCRLEVVKERVGFGNRISSRSFDHASASTKALREIHKALSKQEDALEAEMEELMSSSPELSANYRLLISFKGIGVLTAAMFIILTNNFTRFATPRQFACHVGVAPFAQDSGDSVHVSPHVSKFAHRRAKAALVQSAKCAILYNPVIREYAERLRRKGKHQGIVMNNVKNKIIHIVFKMVETQKEWQPDYQASHMSGNQSLRPLGVSDKKGAAEAAPSADMSVQTSPSTFGGAQSYQNFEKNGNLSGKSCSKTCTET